MTALAAPPTTQAFDALGRANQIRKARAQLKRQLKAAGRDDAQAIMAGILRDPDEELHTAQIGEILTWIPRWGSDKVRGCLARRQINPLYQLAGERTRGTLGVLTARQRELIATDLES